MDIFYTEKTESSKTRYRFLHQKSVKETAPLHNHEHFYEMFIVTRGRALHLVNETTQYLKRGSLVFVRPSDIHKYDYYKDFDFEFINFSFTQDTVHDILTFLDDNIKFQKMLDNKYPPLINLSLKDTKILENEIMKFKEYIIENKNEVSNNSYKIYLIKLINTYFLEDYYSSIV